MASPFSIFRKHQKAMMAVLGVLIMIAFLIFPMLPSMRGESGRRKDPVLVRTEKFGKLHWSQVVGLVAQRQHLQQFLQRLKHAVIESTVPAGGEQAESAESQVTPTGFVMQARELLRRGDSQRAEGMVNFAAQLDPKNTEAKTLKAAIPRVAAIDRLINAIGPISEREETRRAAVDKWLFANEAKDMGIVVTDDMIRAQLKEMAGAVHGQIKTLLKDKRDPMTESQLFGAIREELLALRFQQLAALNVYNLATPGQRWEYFVRLNRFATAEVAQVPVKSFIPDLPTKDPGDAELQKLFEEHKATEANPDSPVPGFKEPRRIEVEYVKADYMAFYDAVTDAEVKKRYDQDPEWYERGEERSQRSDTAEKTPDSGAKPGKPENKPEVKPEPEKKPESKPEKKPEVKPEPEKKPESKPEPEKKTESKPEPEKKTGASVVRPQSLFQLASLAEEKRTADEKETVNQTKTADEKKPPEAKSTPTEPKPAEEKKTPGEKKPADEKPAPSGTKPEPKTAEVPAPPQKPPKERPSIEVKQRIRSNLAKEKMKEALQSVTAALEDHQKQWAKNPEAKSLPPLDTAKLVAGYEGRLTYGNTGMVSLLELRQREVGKSVVSVPTGRTSENVPCAMYVFALKPYQPQDSSDPNRNRPTEENRDSTNQWVFWRTAEDKPARVPSFEEKGVRDAVLRSWQMSQARKSALEKAKALKEEAERDKGRTLQQIFAGRTAFVDHVERSAFTWLTSGSFGLPETSMVAGVEGQPGQKFMQTVFDLRPGQVGVAMNQGETDAYVIRMVNLTPEDELVGRFAQEKLDNYLRVASEQQKQINAAWLAEVYANAGFKWEELPVQKQEETPEEE